MCHLRLATGASSVTAVTCLLVLEAAHTSRELFADRVSLRPDRPSQESDELSAAQILYPAMQCADIFFLGVRFLYLVFRPT